MTEEAVVADTNGAESEDPKAEEQLATEANGADNKETKKTATDAKADNVAESKESKPEIDEDLENSIIHQVEYYFGDLNMCRDKFLREQVKLDDGWVPLSVMITFNRLAKMSTDLDVIANALRKSTSGLLEISDDNRKIRRHPELPVPEMNEERRKEVQGRTVYAKGFPKDSALDDLMKFFNGFGEVEHLIMRKYQEKNTTKRLFKGSVFVTYKNKETAEKFVSTSPQKYGETELLVHWQDAYLKKKQDEYTEKKEKQEKKKEKAAKAAAEPKDEFKLPLGTVLLVSETSDSTKREDIKDALTALGAEVAYIDFKVGDTQGWVRLTKENAAKEILEKITDGKLKINDKEVSVKLVEGDEEKSYLEKTVEEMAKRRKNNKTFGKFNNKNRNQNYQKGRFGRKRKQDQHEDAPPSKVTADAS